MSALRTVTEPSRPDPAPRDAARLEADHEADWVRVRVWDLPVRALHWIIVAAIFVLSGTGLYMGTPVIRVGDDPAFLMGKMRVVHLVAGWVLLSAVTARIVWAFTGTYWARWHQFVPWHRERRRQLWPTLSYYLFLRREPPEAVGHNPLAGVTYLAVYLLLGVMIVTGLAVEQLATRSGFIWAVTGWVFTLAPIPMVRLLHHMGMWLLLAFTVHHVYSAVLIDWEERSGLVSSIITGYKRTPRSRLTTAPGRAPVTEQAEGGGEQV